MLTVSHRAASNWSADRVMRRFPDFMNINLNSDSDNPILFTGEMVNDSSHFISVQISQYRIGKLFNAYFDNISDI